MWPALATECGLGLVTVAEPAAHQLTEVAGGAWAYVAPTGGWGWSNAGLVVDTVSTWGNWQCVVGNLRRWPAYRGWHPLRNDPDVAVQVWAFARNPAGEARRSIRKRSGRDFDFDALTELERNRLAQLDLDRQHPCVDRT